VSSSTRQAVHLFKPNSSVHWLPGQHGGIPKKHDEPSSLHGGGAGGGEGGGGAGGGGEWKHSGQPTQLVKPHLSAHGSAWPTHHPAHTGGGEGG